MAKIFVCGDICNSTPGLDFIGGEMKNVISEVDYAICNFEGVELKPGQIAKCPHQEPGTSQYLKNIGFDLMLLANNHITDLGRDGLIYSIEKLKSTNVDFMGAGLSWDETYKPLIKNICGIKFGFVNVCEAQEGHFMSRRQLYGYAWMGYDKLFDDVKEISKRTDIVIVFVHAGLEHYDTPLPELREMYYRLCDYGASCVICSHPHIAQGYESYQNSLIVYSLGNFYFPREKGIYENENTSYSMILDIDKNHSVNPKIIYHTYNNGIVDIEKDVENQINIHELNKLLYEDYDERVNNMCNTAYDTLCQHLLAEAVCGEPDNYNFIDIIKDIIRRTFFRYKFNKTKIYRNKLLLRLFENEIYKSVIIRALKNKIRR